MKKETPKDKPCLKVLKAGQKMKTKNILNEFNKHLQIPTFKNLENKVICTFLFISWKG